MSAQSQSDKRPREWWIYKTGKLTLASDTMLKNVKVRFLGEPPVFVREVLPDTQTNTASDRDSKYRHKRRQYWREWVIESVHEVAKRPGYEPIDEDTLIGLVAHIADRLEAAQTLKVNGEINYD